MTVTVSDKEYTQVSRTGRGQLSPFIIYAVIKTSSLSTNQSSSQSFILSVIQSMKHPVDQSIVHPFNQSYKQ